MSTHKLSAPRITRVISRAFRTIQRACLATSTTCHSEVRSKGRKVKPEYDAVIVGAGHNGLITAAYLAKSGLKVAVLEKRHVIGGAAVTEEIIPGYKFSRASYLLSLLRPQIYSDLELKKHGLKVYLRNPHSYTPLLDSNRSLLLGANQKTDYDQIAQFSVKDAKAYSKYESHLGKLSAAVEPLLDAQPINSEKLFNFSMIDKFRILPSVAALVKSGRILGKDIPAFYELITAPGSKVLDRWFESEPLKATLGTDAVIGAMASPYSHGSGYVLLHHVMGELEGIKGAWGYPEGGMGGVSEAIARSARSHGANIFTNKSVAKVIVNNNKAEGVFLEDGTEIKAKMVLCNPTPQVTYLDLLDQGTLPENFRSEVSSIDYTSPVTKINVALDRLPNFKADPNNSDGTPRPHHRCTIHLNCETLGQIHEAYMDAMKGRPSKRPVIEMMLPSTLDPTLAPPGHHVCLLFTQYTPYHLAGGKTWDTGTKQQYANSVFDSIEGYAPGFKDSIVGVDHLSPVDLEKTFGLTGGNIFHGSMSLDQLYFGRPVPTYCDTRCPVVGMYLCGSGAHPGGGVMGSPGRLAAVAALQDWKNKCL